MGQNKSALGENCIFVGWNNSSVCQNSSLVGWNSNPDRWSVEVLSGSWVINAVRFQVVMGGPKTF